MTYRDTLLTRFAAAASSPCGVTFLDQDEGAIHLGYAALLSRAEEVASGLLKLGLLRGDRVAVVLPTAPTFYDAFFGALLAGLVPVPLYPPIRLGRLSEYHRSTAVLLRRSRARVVLTDFQMRRVLGRPVQDSHLPLGCHDIDEVRAPAGELAPVGDDDLAFLQFSSGTTGEPRPVALTHGQVLANVDAILATVRRAYPESSGRRHHAVSWLPLYHDMGLVGCVIAALCGPVDLTLLPPELFVARPAAWLRAISRARGTVSPAPNFAYALCADRLQEQELQGLDLSSWQLALCGAEPVTAAALTRFVDRFARVGLRAEALTPVYGLAEATLAVTFANATRPFRATHFDTDLLAEQGQAMVTPAGQALVSCGKPLDGFALRVVDEHGAELPSERLGRIHVRGPSLMRGYDGDAATTRLVLKDGWLDTGDMGFVYDGEIYLYGRAKDLVLVRGRKYAPQLIEQVATLMVGARPGCAAAVSVPNAQGASEELIVFLERNKETPPELKDNLSTTVRQAVLAATGLLARDVIVLEPGTLPRTSSGKIRRQETLARYRRGTLRPPERVTTLGIMREMARSSWLLWRHHP